MGINNQRIKIVLVMVRVLNVVLIFCIYLIKGPLSRTFFCYGKIYSLAFLTVNLLCLVGSLLVAC